MKKNKQNNITDIELINYYEDKIKNNRKKCKIRNIIFIVIFFLVNHLDKKTYDNDIVNKVVFVLIPCLLLTYLIWWTITFLTRMNYKKKQQLLIDKGNCYIECAKCKKLKELNKKCEICGYDDNLKDSKVIELLDELDSKKDKAVWICVAVIIIFIIFCLSLMPSGSGISSSSGSGDAAGWGNLLFAAAYYMVQVAIAVFGIIGVLVIIALTTSKIGKYNHKIKLLCGDKFEKCSSCDNYIKKNGKKHKCEFDDLEE